MDNSTQKITENTQKSAVDVNSAKDLAYALSSAAKASGDGWKTRCPAHEDDKPSLYVSDDLEKDRILWHCMAGCSQKAVHEALVASGLWRSRRSAGEEYIYTDFDETPLYKLVKRPAANAESSPERYIEIFDTTLKRWVRGKLEDHAIERVLYRLPDLRSAGIKKSARLYIVEGEKDAETLRAFGFCATTNSGGASAWKPEFTKLLADKHLCIVPDNDTTGWKRAETLYKEFKDCSKSLFLCNTSLLIGEKGDITDIVECWRENGADDAVIGAKLKEIFGDIHLTNDAACFDFQSRSFMASMSMTCQLQECTTTELIAQDFEEALRRRLGVRFMALHVAKLPSKISDGLEDRSEKKRLAEITEQLKAALGQILRNECHVFNDPKVNQRFMYLPSQSAHYDIDFKAYESAIATAYANLLQRMLNSWALVDDVRLPVSGFGKIAKSTLIDTMTPEAIDETLYLCAKGNALDLRSGAVTQLSSSVFRQSALQVSLLTQPMTQRPKIWQQFLDGVGFEGEIADFFEDLTLYLLTTSTAREEAYFLVGDGSNGKSTYIKWLTSVVGRHHVSSASLQDFQTNFGASSMVGKRLNLSTESSNRDFVESHKFKAIVTGDSVQVDRKNRDPITAAMKTKLVFALNDSPSISDTSFGMVRRMVIVRFDTVISKENAIDGYDRLLFDASAEIIAWLWHSHTTRHNTSAFKVKFEMPDRVRSWAEAIFASDNDPLNLWIYERVTVTDDRLKMHEYTSAQLYRFYCVFCKNQGLEPSFKLRSFSSAFPHRVQRVFKTKVERKTLSGNRSSVVNLIVDLSKDNPELAAA